MAGIAVAVLAGLLYYAIVSFLGFGIPCVFKTVTGLNCPGCGVSRMAVALLRFDFKEAFYCQPVIFCFLIPLTICFAKMGIDYVKRGDKSLSLWQNIIVYSAIACLLLYCVYSNIMMYIK